jgi:YesN/AraC family two-component response regulator
MNGTRESRIVTLEKIPEGKLEYVNADSSPDENLYHSLEQRYEKESEGMDCIARGDVEGAEKIFVSPMFTRMEHRSSDALRSEKNFMIVANTIYRKAAEAGKVHPIYLDRLSRQYSQLIENISGVDEIAPMSKKMIRGYCMLVKTHSTSSYSPMIAHAMNFISLNISDEMNLSKVAEICNANRSYLSSQFKKETGMTITDFINSKKINHAVFMINAQSGSFSEIAAACGISDITYFTRLFKKYKGMSPSEYRALVTG